MGEHLINGEFQSDKYPTTPRGKVPLSCTDKRAQDLLWTYAQRRRDIDATFSADLETALRNAGYKPHARPMGRACGSFVNADGTHSIVVEHDDVGELRFFPTRSVRLRHFHVVQTEKNHTINAVVVHIPDHITWRIDPIEGFSIGIVSHDCAGNHARLVAGVEDIDDKDDAIHHPKHYTAHPSGIECIEIVECMAFCLGNAVKYAWRAGLKSGSRKEDLQKCLWYVRRSAESHHKTAHYSLRREDDRELFTKISAVLACEPTDSPLALILRHLIRRFGEGSSKVTLETITSAIEAEIAKEAP